jgi:hypothetical protein
LAKGQVAIGNGSAILPIDANLYGVLPSPAVSDNSQALQSAIAAAAAIGAAVSIPACGTYSFTNPITGPASAPSPIPNGMKIFAPGGYQCVRFQVSSSWSGTGPALIDQMTPTQGVTLEGITWDGNSKNNVGLVWFNGAPNDQIILRDNRFTGVKGTWDVVVGAVPVGVPAPMAIGTSMPVTTLPASVYLFETIPTNTGEIVASTIFPTPSSSAGTPPPFPIPGGSVLVVPPPTPLPTPSWSPPVPYVCATTGTVCEYNVYVGSSPGLYGLQNASPIPINVTFTLTNYASPSALASPGTLGSLWNGSGIPSTASRLSGNVFENNATANNNEIALLTAWQDGIVDNNVFRNNPSCLDALGIFVYTDHLTASGNQFDSNLCVGGDYYVEGSRNVQSIANQHIIAIVSPTPTGATIPGFAISVRNSKAVSIEDTVELSSSALNTYAMLIQDYLGANGLNPETADSLNSNSINVVPHWTLGLTAGGGLYVGSNKNSTNSFAMHDLYVKGGSITLNIASPSPPANWAGGVVIDCSGSMGTPAAIQNVTVQGVNFPNGTMPAPAPIGSQGQAAIEFVSGNTTCGNLRAVDNSIGVISGAAAVTPTPHAILIKGSYASVVVKGNDLSQWPTLSTECVKTFEARNISKSTPLLAG